MNPTVCIQHSVGFTAVCVCVCVTAAAVMTVGLRCGSRDQCSRSACLSVCVRLHNLLKHVHVEHFTNSGLHLVIM